MSRFLLAGCLAILSAAGSFAQSDSPRWPAPADPVLEPERVPIKPGDPLSVRALVASPPAVRGVQSWSLETRIHRGLYSTAALSPDGKVVATGGLDGTIRLWDLRSGKLLRAFLGHDGYVHCLTFSPAGRYLASGGFHDATARIWEVETGKHVRTLRGHPTYVSQVAWSPDGKWLVGSGGHSGDISMWDVSTGIKRAKAALGRYVGALAIHPDCVRLATITSDSLVILLDLTKGKTDKTLGEAGNGYTTLAWSPDGARLASGGAKGVIVYDLESGAVVGKIDDVPNLIAWTADGKKLAVAVPLDRTLRIWSPADGVEHQKFTATTGTWLRFLPGDSEFLLGDTVGLTVHQTADGKKVLRHELTGTAPPHWSSGRPVITGLGTPTLALWDNTSGKPLRTLEGHKAAISAFAWSPDGKSLATASFDRTVRVWESATGSLQHTLGEHKDIVFCLAWAPDGKEIASGGRDKTVQVWNAKAGTLTQSLTDHVADVSCLAWSPDGRTLATGTRDGTTTLYARSNWKAGKPLVSPHKFTSLAAMAWSPDGKSLVAGDVVWSLAKGTVAGELVKNVTPFTTMIFYPKTDILAGARGGHGVELWSLKSLKRLESLPTIGTVQRLAWSNSGPLLAVAASDRTCRFFVPATGKYKGCLVAEPDQLVGVSADGHFSADGPAVNHLICVVQSDKGQETYTPAEFATRFGWKNNPTKARFTTK